MFPFISEVLLFDFTLEVGDEVEVFAGGWKSSIQIEEVSYEDFNGITRKAIHLGYGRWIEGIGSDRGLLYAITPNLSSYYTLQKCMRIEGEIIFNHEEGEYDCSLVSVEDNEWEISVYPNPNNGRFKIEGLNGEATVELFDYSGRKIDESQDVPENGDVNFQDALPFTGIYFAKISYGDSVRIVRISID